MSGTEASAEGTLEDLHHPYGLSVRSAALSGRTKNSATFAVTSANVEIPTTIVNTPTIRPTQ